MVGLITCASIDSHGLFSNGKGLRAGESDHRLDAPVQGGVTGGGQGSRLQVCCCLLLLLLQGCCSSPGEVVGCLLCMQAEATAEQLLNLQAIQGRSTYEVTDQTHI